MLRTSMEAGLSLIGFIVGIGIITWFPLMLLLGLLLRTEIKRGAQGARYWAFPLLVKPDQLTLAGLKLRTVHASFLGGAVAIWMMVFVLGLLFP